MERIDALDNEYETWLNKYKEDNKHLHTDDKMWAEKNISITKEFRDYQFNLIDRGCKHIDNKIAVYNELLQLHIKGSIRYCETSIKELNKDRINLRWTENAWRLSCN